MKILILTSPDILILHRLYNSAKFGEQLFKKRPRYRYRIEIKLGT